jgi:Putative transposase
LKYLAPYIFRIALSNNRIEQVANEMVTFRYTEGKTGVHKRATLGIDSFIGRFLAHVLAKGFVKVRFGRQHERLVAMVGEPSNRSPPHPPPEHDHL